MSEPKPQKTPESPSVPKNIVPATPKPADEFGATDKPEPTRYGDWEIGGRCVDF